MKKQEKAIKEIISRYGEVINIKKTPYIIAEIVRNYGEILHNPGDATSCLPPGGPPKRGDKVINPGFKKEIMDLSKQIKAIQKRIDSLIR